MACKTVLFSFEVKSYKGHSYNENEEFELMRDDVEMGQYVQTLIEKVFDTVKECVARTIVNEFALARSRIFNMNNFLHIATSFTQSFVQNADGSQGQTATTLTCKFYKIEERGDSYRVMMDLEQMPSSSLDPDENRFSWSRGFSNDDVKQLKELLNEHFILEDRIEYTPIIKRGRLQTPCFLISSDERIMEYDLESTLVHKKSEYQDIKIVNSHTLGKLLLLDDLQNLAESDFDYTRTLMDRGYENYFGKEILILGGGDGGLLWELIKEDPKMVTMAEIDKSVIDACKNYMFPFGEVLEHMEGKNFKIIIEDCIQTLRRNLTEGKKYDYIFNDLTDFPVTKRKESLTAFEPSLEQQDSPWHFIEGIFNLSMACLKDGGCYMNHATGKGNRNSLLSYEKFLQESRFELEFEKRNAYVPSFMEYWVFYTVKKLGVKKNKGSQLFAGSQQHVEASSVPAGATSSSMATQAKSPPGKGKLASPKKRK